MFLIKSLRGAAAIVSFIAGLCLLMGLASIWIDPGKFVLPAFFGLSYPIFYLINVFLLITALIRRNKVWIIFHGALLVFGVFQFGHFFNFTSGSEGEKAKLKVVSFNVRSFNRYDWIEEDSIQFKIERFIKNEDADVVCFQEFHLKGKEDIKAIRKFARRIGLKHFVFNDFRSTKDISGLVTFSRYPINTVYREHFHPNNFGGNGFLICELKKDGDAIRVVNMHLESIRFEQTDYAYAEDPTNDRWEFKIAGVRLINRFIKAYKQRGAQAKLVAKYVEQSNVPVILAGDANDTPVSFVYHTLSRSLKDSFTEGSLGTGGTYAGNLPSFRIDYIMHSPSLNTVSHRVGNEKLSDHYPVISEFSWK